MLVRPKYNSKYRRNCIRYQDPRLWNRVDNKLKLTANLHSMVLDVYVSFLRLVFLENPVKYGYICICICVYLCHHFVHTSSLCRRTAPLWLLFCIASYPTCIFLVSGMPCFACCIQSHNKFQMHVPIATRSFVIPSSFKSANFRLCL